MIEAIATGERPDLDRADEVFAHDFTHQLVTHQRVDDATYSGAKTELADQGLVDLVLLVGRFLTVCSIINAFDVDVPDERSQPAARAGLREEARRTEDM